MFHSKKKVILIFIGLLLVVGIGLIFLSLSNCKYPFNNVCLSKSNYWSEFKAGDLIPTYKDNTTQLLTLKSSRLELNISLNQKPFPARSEALQYRELSKTEADNPSADSYVFKDLKIGVIDNLVIYCKKYETNNCYLFETSENERYKEKTMSLINNEYSYIEIKKEDKVVQNDIDEIIDVLRNIYTGPK